MKKDLRAAVTMFGLLMILTGVVYPALVTVVAQTVFREQANGGLIERDGKPIGADLIGQPFDSPLYFWGRPSATAPAYNAAASTGSNLGPTNPALLDAVAGRIAAIREAHPGRAEAVPIDLVTASASGLDPDISPAAAEYQIGRVAAARGLGEAEVRRIVQQQTAGRTFGVLGEPRVNVLRLNLALDAATAGGNARE